MFAGSLQLQFVWSVNACSLCRGGKRRGPLSQAQEVGRALHRIIQAVEQGERQEEQQVAEVGGWAGACLRLPASRDTTL